jgi:hypothetical protein
MWEKPPNWKDSCNQCQILKIRTQCQIQWRMRIERQISKFLVVKLLSKGPLKKFAQTYMLLKCSFTPSCYQLELSRSACHSIRSTIRSPDIFSNTLERGELRVCLVPFSVFLTRLPPARLPPARLSAYIVSLFGCVHIQSQARESRRLVDCMR